ncbi:hypothetical protein Tco_1275223 [Tanacetum coccineum]
MERGFLNQKGSGGGRGVKEKQVSMADKSVEVSKHVNVALGSNSATRTPNVVNAGLESFPTVSEAHRIYFPGNANEEKMNTLILSVKRTYKEDLECEMVMVKMPRCMSWLGSTDAYDEPIGSLEEDFWKPLMEVEPLGIPKLEDVVWPNLISSLSSREF